MQKQVVVVPRFWTIGILATVLIFGQMSTYSSPERFDRKKRFRKNNFSNPPKLNRRLMHSESGSRNIKRG
jgi:hypothetical protein